MIVLSSAMCTQALGVCISAGGERLGAAGEVDADQQAAGRDGAEALRKRAARNGLVLVSWRLLPQALAPRMSAAAVLIAAVTRT